ncbi:hypothetical protein X798_00520 [Onchocerca flexuosa]|uniref:DUF2628 domain-containing protein n=2 Tax=Onchocerca flexuosa TaxID=387005 RepID=A0A183I118_9BILA|nr:hypothetical protein X798_00520 [Onchocerca flexuosa]VDP13731.1 unnamed protein product [Onchocerca flexuosa]
MSLPDFNRIISIDESTNCMTLSDSFITQSQPSQLADHKLYSSLIGLVGLSAWLACFLHLAASLVLPVFLAAFRNIEGPVGVWPGLVFWLYSVHLHNRANTKFISKAVLGGKGGGSVEVVLFKRKRPPN